MTVVRTRFAPSPTGFQHIGGFRTAFYAFLLAKHFGGQFILRIEDTDRERLVPGTVGYILKELSWFGITPDEGPSRDELERMGEWEEGLPAPGGPCGPYVQSMRLARYREVAEQLIAAGVCYRCDCTHEMLERERNEQMARKELPGYSGYCRTRDVAADTRHVVRFKMPPKVDVVMMDAVKGRVAWESVPMRDPVLLKSDGFPTYHLAVVVDDHDMQITHVMRGDEWLSSAPLHLKLYEALGWEPPVFAHLPVVLGPDGKKLSKRHGATLVTAFREDGYLAQALLNFVTLIGWSPGEGEEQEIFSREELVRRFSLEHINTASAVFHYTKLEWMNGMYIRKMSIDEFVDAARPFMDASGLNWTEDRFRIIAPHVQERVKLLKEVPPMVDFLFMEEIDPEMGAVFNQKIDKETAVKVLEESHKVLGGLEDFSVTVIDGEMRALAERLGLKPGPMFSVIRIAVTGKTVTPPLFESIFALGKDRVLERISALVPKVRDFQK